MSAEQGPRRELPARPSVEHLRKQAKRLARAESLGLAEAQRRLAAEYGSPSWADLLRRVRRGRALSPLAAAARAGDLAAVERLLAEGHPVDGQRDEGGTPLWHACAGDGGDRVAVVERLLAAGASPRRSDAGATPLHAAAARGPLALVEALIRGGALEWQADRKGRPPLDAARRGKAAERDAIIELLDRPVIRDPSFRAAVAAIQRGDAGELAGLLGAEPRLLRERILEPDCYRAAARPQYFRDPKLFWFVANNPTLVATMPPGMVDAARVMIARGVDQADLDYALGLIMTSSPAREQGLQIPLLQLLMQAGATASAQAVLSTLAHREIAAVEAMLAAGHPLSATIAAGLGRTDDLARLLPAATAGEIQDALGVAVINRRTQAARLLLDAGADVNAFLPVHAHSTPLHQAALDGELALMELLVARGARLDTRDTLWEGTPLAWARHSGNAAAVAWLEERSAG